MGPEEGGGRRTSNDADGEGDDLRAVSVMSREIQRKRGGRTKKYESIAACIATVEYATLAAPLGLLPNSICRTRSTTRVNCTNPIKAA